MIYFVSGFPRSGTSMMMRCLMKGGMKAKIDKDNEKDILNRLSKPGWPINPSINEITLKQLNSPNFRKECDGCLVKVMGGELLNKTEEGDKVIYLLRDWEEISKSYEAVFDRPIEWTKKQLDCIRSDIIGLLIERGIDVIPIWYGGVVGNPELHFRMIKRMGWPIIAVDAAREVNPNLYRMRN